MHNHFRRGIIEGRAWLDTGGPRGEHGIDPELQLLGAVVRIGNHGPQVKRAFRGSQRDLHARLDIATLL